MSPPLSQEQETLLKKIYYEDKLFFGRDKIFDFVKNNHPESKISRRQVQDWLKKQETYQLNLRPPKRKSTKPVLTKVPGYLQLDITEIPNRYNGYRYLLGVIDVFTKQVNFIALKNVETQTIVNKLDALLNPFEKVSVIQTDNGAQFLQPAYKNYFDSNNIKRLYSKTHTPQSQGNIECANGTIKRLIYHLIATGDKNWPKFHPDFVDNINNTIQFSTKKTPNEIVDSSAAQQSAAQNLTTKFNKNPQNTKLPKLNIGDVVRVVLIKGKLQKKSVKTFTKEKYVISFVKRSRKPYVLDSYKLTNSNGFLIEGTYC